MNKDNTTIKNMKVIETNDENGKTMKDNIINIPLKLSFFKNIPDQILETEILSFLNSNDLFYSVRGVCTEWSNIMKNVWSGKIKDDLLNQVKVLDFVYEKEAFSKTYEFKMKYMLDYRSLLSQYNNTANILNILHCLYLDFDDEEIEKLTFFFLKFLNFDDVFENSFNKESILLYLSKETTYNNVFKPKMNQLLNIEDFLDFDLIILEQYREDFNCLNKELLESLNESAKLVYSFLQGLIELQILKFEVKDLRFKIEDLILRIQLQTKQWQKKKNFFEKSYKLILFTKTNDFNILNIINVFEANKIKHPLIDFNDEALNLIFDLKLKLNSNERICNLNKDLNEELTNCNQIDEMIFENILNRRILLTKKLLILEKFYLIYEDCLLKQQLEEESEQGLNITNNDNIFLNVLDNKLTLKQFLWCLKISSNSEQEEVTKESILRTKEYLDLNFDYQNHTVFDFLGNKNSLNEVENNKSEEEILINLSKEEEAEYSNEEDEQIYTEADVLKLKREKERLEEQKEKTENLLKTLKRFIKLKENMLNNKRKYKGILSVLSKLRSGQLTNAESVNNLISIGEAVEEKEENSSNSEQSFSKNLNENNDFLSENEKLELENFNNSEHILEEIEAGLMEQIAEIFGSNKQ